MVLRPFGQGQALPLHDMPTDFVTALSIKRATLLTNHTRAILGADKTSLRVNVMANGEHLAVIEQGVEVWDNWRKKNPQVRPDLRGANLRGADLSYAHLSSADLSYAHLSDANLSGANLRNANLSGANLSRANLNGISIDRTMFGNNDLSVVEGLDSIGHWGPSTIGTNTLYKSKGQISEAFLRKCGLSDWEIESAKLYNPDLNNEEINNIHYRIHDLRVSRAFQINPLFISYSHIDTDFVDVLDKRLTDAGVRFWRDIHHAKAGRLEKQIDQAIHLNDVVLLVLSEHSTNSDWVEYEAHKAREKEQKTGKDALCPIALDDSWKTCSWPGWLRVQIKKYNVLDFSNWTDDDCLQKMFGKLLEGLDVFYK